MVNLHILPLFRDIADFLLNVIDRQTDGPTEGRLIFT